MKLFKRLQCKYLGHRWFRPFKLPGAFFRDPETGRVVKEREPFERCTRCGAVQQAGGPR